MRTTPSLWFIFLALCALTGGVFMGCIGGIQFLEPEFATFLPFIKVRPLHVSLVVAWIFLSAMGGIYYYLPKYAGAAWIKDASVKIHFWLFFITGLIILGCYIGGYFGGREYWEYPVWLSAPVMITWIIFGVNFFRTVFKRSGPWPVYLWMWATGVIFFFITFTEAHLWIFPYFRSNAVRDLTVQWKSYGALVGSWNMLVYGTAIFLVSRIKNDESYAHSKLAFGMYFLGFSNLLFGWAHHIYIIPSALWVRLLSYGMSMTELIILARIIWTMRSSIDDGRKNFHILPYRFLMAADFWVFLNLSLALAISVPAINIYTHGTHVTVAHAMGSTIGINTMILLASCFFLIKDIKSCSFNGPWISSGFWILNSSLVIFWFCLIAAGIVKGILIVEDQLTFAAIMEQIRPFLWGFALSGLGILAGLGLIIYPALRAILYPADKSL